MKYEVIGWTHCGTQMYPPHDAITACVDKAVIKEIRKYGYLFGGDRHEDYCPVLNDGTYVSYSWRGWGRIMALAYNKKGEYSYMCAYMDSMIKPAARKYPPNGIPDDERIVPKETLTETFVMRLADDMFEKVKNGTKTLEIRLFDDKRKQVDIGDYIEFRKESNPEERIKLRVKDLDLWETFQKAFTRVDYEKEKRIETLRFPPEQLGFSADATPEELIEGMYRFYSKEDEKKHGVIIFTLEKPAHACTTCFKVLLDSEECHRLYSERLAEPDLAEEEFSRLLDECFDTDLAEGALGEITEGFQRRWKWFEYGKNSEYNVDVNVMLRQTLSGLFGKEEQLKAVRDRFCIDPVLQVFTVIAKGSEEPNQYLSLERDIIEFLHKAGVRLQLDYCIV